MKLMPKKQKQNEIVQNAETEKQNKPTTNQQTKTKNMEKYRNIITSNTGWIYQNAIKMSCMFRKFPVDPFPKRSAKSPLSCHHSHVITLMSNLLLHHSFARIRVSHVSAGHAKALRMPETSWLVRLRPRPGSLFLLRFAPQHFLRYTRRTLSAGEEEKKTAIDLSHSRFFSSRKKYRYLFDAWRCHRHGRQLILRSPYTVYRTS